MNWAQLTNRPNNGSQRYNNNNNNNHNNNYNNNNNNNYHQNKSNNNRRTINNLNYSNKYKGYQNRNHHNNSGPRNQYYLTQQNNNNSRNTRNVGITSGKRRHNDVNYVILDAGAFIGRQSFFNNFNPNTVYYMTPAVQNEIRDKQSRQFLERFPYEIKVRKPDQESVQFVNTYLQKNPNLKNLSKVDRQIIALAHTLEREYHGTGHLSQSKYPKAMTVIGGATGKDKSNKKPVKKSKTGRIHREAKPIKDTGVRLAMFKKVIPFHFDDFMTLSQDKYGEKYGKPTPNEWMAASPVRGKQANIMEDELKDNKMNLDENKDNKEANKSKEKKAEQKENQVKYNPNIKAMTEAPVKDKKDEQPSPISKSRRRKERKKRANQAKQDKIAEKSALTEETLLAFQIQEDKDEDSDDDDDGDIMKEITLEDIDKLKEDIEQQKLKENQLDETKSNAESEKSEIDKMIEEDITMFNETASLISSISEQSTKQFKQANQMQYRLDLNVNKQYNSAPAGVPRISQSQSLPANADADSIAFGTLFQGTTGSLFPSSAVVNSNSSGGTGGLAATALSNSPLPPIDQNCASNPMPVSPYQQPAVPQPHPEVHTQAQPRQGQQQQQQQQPQQQQIRPQPIRPQPQQKITINEAWQGDWLGENNYKPVPKNEAKRKKAKLKNVQDSSNEDSSVALITVDQTMQKAMIGMGLRVLTTSADRQYGNNRNGRKGGRYNNGEPVDLKFRCFSCYNMENDTTRITCRHCGNQTFQRVSIYQDENGRYHDRYSYVDRYTTRYKKGIVPYASGTRKINQQNMANSQPNNRRNNNKKKNKYNQRKNNQSVGGGGGGGRYRGGWRQM